LVGSATWELVAADLSSTGFDPAVVDLTGTIPAGPPYSGKQAEVIACGAADQPAVLVGHSGAGPLLPAAGMIIGRVRGYVFVDAGLPTPGRSWMETAPPDLAGQLRGMADDRGWLPPWPQWWSEEVMAELLPDQAVRQRFVADCQRLPLAMFEEAQAPAPQWPDAPVAYLQLSEAYQDQAATARERGWRVREQISHHLGMLTEPARVAASLRDLLDQLTRTI
jgi:hypothetical protein